MNLRLSSWLVALGIFVPLATACSATTGDETTPDPSSEDADSVSSDVKAGKKKPKKLTCAEVFGTCVGLSPSSCVGGTWADATVVTCGGGLGVGCCVRPTPPPPPPPPPPVPTPDPCPTLSPPAPSFCPGGTITPRKDGACIVGYDCVPPPGKTLCEVRGGTCVGLAPSSCASGHWGDASTHSCGPGIGVGCCLP